MELKRTTNILRWIVAIGVGLILFRWTKVGMAHSGGMDIGLAFEIVILLLLYGLLLFGLFGRSIIFRVADRFAGLYWPDDSKFRVVPQFSIAEARVKEGKYKEAIEEYRTIILQHPTDVYPHLRIAELTLEQLHDTKLAELELQSAVAKAGGSETAALAAGRLADFYQQTLRDRKRALEVVKQLRIKLASSKHAKLVDERITTLERMVAGHQVPKSPAKITVKQADEAEIRRRRGF